MKKTYNAPSVQIINVVNTDIICASENIDIVSTPIIDGGDIRSKELDIDLFGEDATFDFGE